MGVEDLIRVDTTRLAPNGKYSPQGLTLRFPAPPASTGKILREWGPKARLEKGGNAEASGSNEHNAPTEGQQK